MGARRNPYDARETFRLYQHEKDKLKGTGVPTRDFVMYAVNDFYSRNPRKKAEIMAQIYNNRLEELKREKCEIQAQIDNVLEKIDELKLAGVTLNEERIEPLEKFLDPNIKESIRLAQNVFNRKMHLYNSSLIPEKECIINFINDNKGLINDIWFKHASKVVSEDEFKEILLDELVVC